MQLKCCVCSSTDWPPEGAAASRLHGRFTSSLLFQYFHYKHYFLCPGKTVFYIQLPKDKEENRATKVQKKAFTRPHQFLSFTFQCQIYCSGIKHRCFGFRTMKQMSSYFWSDFVFSSYCCSCLRWLNVFRVVGRHLSKVKTKHLIIAVAWKSYNQI